MPKLPLSAERPTDRRIPRSAMGSPILGSEGDDLLNGTADNDVIIGFAGNDSIDGGAGSDVMVGGTGDDVYFVDSSGDDVAENADEGLDSIYASVSYGIGGGSRVERLFADPAIGTVAINLTGNAFANTLFGNAAANSLNGGAGNDIIFGYAGNDSLDGGTGDDVLAGGLGDDVYVVDSNGDDVIENFGEGRDAVYSTLSYGLGGGASIELLIGLGTADINLTGNALANTISGNAGANVIAGGGSNDILLGLAGNDSLDGGTGNDVLVGGVGDDIYFVDSTGDEVVEYVGEGRDGIYAAVSFGLAAGNSIEALFADPAVGNVPINLTGNEIANSLYGNGATNILSGGDGNDLLIGYAGDDVLDGGSGMDVLVGGTGDDIYFVDLGSDEIIEAEGEGIDSVYARFDYTLASGISIERLLAITPDNAFTIMTLTGNERDNAIYGHARQDVLIGGDGNDVLFGFGGQDTLDGGSGSDTLIGGTGDDRYYIRDALDTIIEEEFGGGYDSVTAFVDYVLPEGLSIEALYLAGPFTAARSLTGNSAANFIFGDYGNNRLFGGGGDDVIAGGSGDDYLDGGSGDDQMDGGDGDDTYIVDSLLDRTSEGTFGGRDRIYTSVGSTSFNSNIEEIFALDRTSLAPLNFSASSVQLLEANDGSNVIRVLNQGTIVRAFGGDDQLTGGTAYGGLGDDTYFVFDYAQTIAIESPGEGTDTIITTISYTLAAGTEVEILQADAQSFNFINLTGNTDANRLVGNNSNNILSGLGGNDVIEGNGGDDTIDGGTGNDQMSGGFGNDTYVVDSQGDNVIEIDAQGYDTILSSVNYTLAAGTSVESLWTTNVAGTAPIDFTGNERANSLIGNAGANYLSGGGGNDDLSGRGGNDVLDGGTGGDFLTGGLGDDEYIVDNVGDAIQEFVGEGFDTISTSISWALSFASNSNDVERLRVRDAASTNAIDLTGNSRDNILEGNAGNNILSGGGGRDVIYGFAGNDTLTGDGLTTLVGGLGNDTYRVALDSTEIVELAGQGYDVVRLTGTSVNRYTMAENISIEELVLEENAFYFQVIGNSSANIIRGNAGGNRLNGGGGADTIYGGAGNDIYIVNDANLTIVENLDEGSDQVETTVSFSLAGFANVESLFVSDPNSLNTIDLAGNGLANLLYGNNGNNRIEGGAGADTLEGYGGNDILIGGSGNDIMRGGAGDDTYYFEDQFDNIQDETGGYDTVIFSVSFTQNSSLSLEVMRTVDQSATTALNLVGTQFTRLIEGNNGNNILSASVFGSATSIYGFGGNDRLTSTAANADEMFFGGDGDDVIDSGPGFDTVNGGAGADQFVLHFIDSGYFERITDFEVGLDKILLDAPDFEGVLPGELLASSFVIGTAALDADDFIIYNPATGTLFFDEDGNGAVAAVQFAILTGAPSITATDFLIV